MKQIAAKISFLEGSASGETYPTNLANFMTDRHKEKINSY